jgi:hypothetical protein
MVSSLPVVSGAASSVPTYSAATTLTKIGLVAKTTLVFSGAVLLLTAIDALAVIIPISMSYILRFEDPPNPKFHNTPSKCLFLASAISCYASLHLLKAYPSSLLYSYSRLLFTYNLLLMSKCLLDSLPAIISFNRDMPHKFLFSVAMLTITHLKPGIGLAKPLAITICALPVITEVCHRIAKRRQWNRLTNVLTPIQMRFRDSGILNCGLPLALGVTTGSFTYLMMAIVHVYGMTKLQERPIQMSGYKLNTPKTKNGNWEMEIPTNSPLLTSTTVQPPPTDTVKTPLVPTPTPTVDTPQMLPNIPMGAKVTIAPGYQLSKINLSFQPRNSNDYVTGWAAALPDNMDQTALLETLKDLQKRFPEIYCVVWRGLEITDHHIKILQEANLADPQTVDGVKWLISQHDTEKIAYTHLNMEKIDMTNPAALSILLQLVNIPNLTITMDNHDLYCGVNISISKTGVDILDTFLSNMYDRFSLPDYPYLRLSIRSTSHPWEVTRSIFNALSDYINEVNISIDTVEGNIYTTHLNALRLRKQNGQWGIGEITYLNEKIDALKLSILKFALSLRPEIATVNILGKMASAASLRLLPGTEWLSIAGNVATKALGNGIFILDCPPLTRKALFDPSISTLNVSPEILEQMISAYCAVPIADIKGTSTPKDAKDWIPLLNNFFATQHSTAVCRASSQLIYNLQEKLIAHGWDTTIRFSIQTDGGQRVLRITGMDAEEARQQLFNEIKAFQDVVSLIDIDGRQIPAAMMKQCTQEWGLARLIQEGAPPQQVAALDPPRNIDGYSCPAARYEISRQTLLALIEASWPTEQKIPLPTGWRFDYDSYKMVIPETDTLHVQDLKRALETDMRTFSGYYVTKTVSISGKQREMMTYVIREWPPEWPLDLAVFLDLPPEPELVACSTIFGSFQLLWQSPDAQGKTVDDQGWILAIPDRTLDNLTLHLAIKEVLVRFSFISKIRIGQQEFSASPLTIKNGEEPPQTIYPVHLLESSTLRHLCAPGVSLSKIENPELHKAIPLLTSYVMDPEGLEITFHNVDDLRALAHYFDLPALLERCNQFEPAGEWTQLPKAD